MKRFLIISLTFLCTTIDTRACYHEVTYNYYMFSVFNRESINPTLFADQFLPFWEKYTGKKIQNYNWTKEEIMQIAQQRNDQEMVSYLTELNKYLDISEQLKETWTYPTKQEFRERHKILDAITKKAADYKGTRLKSQWMLLRMRANMVLGENKFNIAYWTNIASKQPPTVYRDMMENIYAGALLRTGNQQEANDIYAKQGDINSIKWTLRKHGNLAGIKEVYKQNPNAYSLIFLIQDFVNNIQDFTDLYEDKKETLSSLVANKTETDAFISFANEVLNSGKSKYPILWKAAIGELQYLAGKQEAAMKTLNEAIGMEGTQRMKDNARVIRLIASVKSAQLNEKYEQFVIQEIEWLCTKRKEKKDGTISERIEDWHYDEMLIRLIYLNLVPKYMQAGNNNMATLLLAMMNNMCDTYEEHQIWLKSLSGDKLKKYFTWLKKNPKGKLERFAKQHTNSVDDNYANDIIATHYIAEGRFKDAIPFLKKVSLAFMEQQNISYYLANRDYTKPYWTESQQVSREIDTDGTGLGKLTYNPKLKFCQEIIRLEGMYGAARNGLKQELAYELAKRYYQASYKGDCWHLTHYGKSIMDTVKIGEMDFIEKSIEYLKVSKQTSDFTLRQNSLYALAFVSQDSWFSEVYDPYTNVVRINVMRQSQQYLALKELNSFVLQNLSKIDRYVTTCDVLQQFRKYE